MQKQTNQGQTPDKQKRKIPWIRIILFSLFAVATIAPGIFLITINLNSLSTSLGFALALIGIVPGIIQIIPIMFPPKPQPSTIIQHIYSPAETQQPVRRTAISPSPTPDTSLSENKTTILPPNMILPTKPVFYFNVAHLPSPDELYGRKRERRTLLERTRKGDSTSIVGPRRIGKTWLLDYLKLMAPTELTTNFRIVSLDGTTTRRKTVSTFVTQALDALGIPLVGNPTELELDILAKAVESLKVQQIKPILCIDEFEGFFNRQDFDCDFFTGLRYLATNGLILITVSKSPLIDLVGERCKTSGFFNIFEQITLKPFNELEAEEFVQPKSREADLYDERAILLKYGQRNEHEWPPLRLQLVGEKLMEDKKLAAHGHLEYYRPGEQDYWENFEQRVEEIYRGAVH